VQLLPRVYPILDTTTLDRFAFDPFIAAEACLEGGARILQLRHKDFWSRETFHLAHRLATLCRESGARLIINDRADCAMLVGSGLHLGQHDLTPTDARLVVGPHALIGFSAHNPEQMAAAGDEPVDYIAFGPVFPTTSKHRADPVVSVDGLRAARALTLRPLVAIGGITPDNAPDCWSAGANSVAVISGIFQAPCTRQAVRDRLAAWRTLAEQFGATPSPAAPSRL
jgi:thiamine-phosphate pyrophosphorylase